MCCFCDKTNVDRVSLHLFPTDENSVGTGYICSDHFVPDYFYFAVPTIQPVQTTEEARYTVNPKALHLLPPNSSEPGEGDSHTLRDGPRAAVIKLNAHRVSINAFSYLSNE